MTCEECGERAVITYYFRKRRAFFRFGLPKGRFGRILKQEGGAYPVGRPIRVLYVGVRCPCRMSIIPVKEPRR